MNDSLVMVNVGNVHVSFRIFKPLACGMNMPRHKLRKVVRNANVDVKILPGQSVDLVPLTELSAATLLTLPEVKSILKSPHVQLKSDLTASIKPPPPSVLVEGAADSGQAAADLDEDSEVVIQPLPESAAETEDVEVEEVEEGPTASEAIQDAIDSLTPPEPSIELPSLSLDDEGSSVSKKKSNKRLFK